MSKGNVNKFKTGYRTSKSFIGRNLYRLLRGKTSIIDNPRDLNFIKRKNNKRLNNINIMRKKKIIYGLAVFLLIAAVFSGAEARAAISCPGAGGSLNVPPSVTVIVNGPCNYTDVTIQSGGLITSDIGEKADMSISGTLTINAGGGIDVSGKGNNTAGQGANGVNVGGTACSGVFGGGSGGSGGSIWLIASGSFDFSGGTLDVKGGNGGSDVNCTGWDGGGGGGGGGRISLQYNGPKIGSGIHTEGGGMGGSGAGVGIIGAVGTFYEDPCLGKTCNDYCNGLTGYRGGTCDAVTGSCNYATVENCADADSCTADSCDTGFCSNVPSCGGIVPCGRLVNNPSTPYDEMQSCTLCHIFIMFQIITTFIFELSGIIAIFFIVVGGLMYAASAGNQRQMEMGKNAVTWAIVGLAIIILSWLIITIVLTILGYINPLGGQWDIVNCSIT